MFSMLKRGFWLALVGGAAFAGWSTWRQKKPSATVSDAPSWPPFESNPSPPNRETLADTAPAVFASLPTERWIAPIDSACPDGYPIKANEHSGIYHQPGGRFYARTVADRCYANEEDAIADGYRAAKS